MARWLRVPLSDGLTVPVDVQMPAELDGAFRQTTTQVRERYGDARQRLRSAHATRLGLAQATATRAEARDDWAQEVHDVVHDWGYFTSGEIERRVIRSAECAVLEQAIALAQEHGLAGLSRQRHQLQQAGQQAAQQRWQHGLSAAQQRLRGSRPARDDVSDGALQQLRWKLEDLANLRAPH